MKLLVIVLCLLSERFLMHSISYQRFSWFGDYVQLIQKYTAKNALFTNPWAMLAALIIPITLVAAVIYLLFYGFLFGFMGLLLSIVIFYYCLGPQNVFYPPAESDNTNNDFAGTYFAMANNQLFAVLFWFVIGGPIAALIYRLISLAQGVQPVSIQATQVTGILEWVPARITALLYLLVGNFQRGFTIYTKLVFSSPVLNSKILSECGLHAVHADSKKEIPMPVAESLVEHATVVLLVLIALFTLGAWL